MEGNMNLISRLRGERHHQGPMTAELTVGISTTRIRVMDLLLVVVIIETIILQHQNKCGILQNASNALLSACLINNLKQDLHISGMLRLQVGREKLTCQHKKV
jgi:hypothetical protein